MPEFTSEIDVDPYEYVSSCSKREIRELIVELVDEGHLPKTVLGQIQSDKEGKPRTSILEDEFLDKIAKLGQKYHTISKEDEETIENIFKKYL